MLSIDNMVIPRDAQHSDLAHHFMNFMLDGKNASELTNLIGSVNPNLAASKYIQPDIARSKTISPDAQVMKKLEQLRDMDSRDLRTLNRLWTEIKLK